MTSLAAGDTDRRINVNPHHNLGRGAVELAQSRLKLRVEHCVHQLLRMNSESSAATSDRQLPAEIKSPNTMQVHATRFGH